jgi:hypothetical protein
MRLLMLAALLFASGQLFAYDRPEPGGNVSERRIVTLKTIPTEEDCVSIRLGTYLLMLSKKRLSDLVSSGLSNWKTEQERLAAIAARRAEMILQRAKQEVDATGCQTVDVLDQDSKYVLLHELEEGEALVLDQRAGSFLKSVEIHYYGNRCGHMCGSGDIIVSVPGNGATFLTVVWWVS